jgi:CopA family copper-resistance protein
MTDPHRVLETPIPRRAMLQSLGVLGVGAGLERLMPGGAPAWTPRRVDDGRLHALAPRVLGGERVHELEIAERRMRIEGRNTTAVTINGTVPGPLIRLREGEEAILRVTNRLRADTSIHWHGLILPPEMDGVPGVSFPGIRPGETFEYRFPIQQSGTYWYHSHSGLQEQLGHYGPLVLDPAEPGPAEAAREFVVVLSDWTFEDPHRVLDRLKKVPDYYNRQRLTLGDFFRDVAKDGLGATIRDRWMWAAMRMNPTDIADVTGTTYSYLVNGLAPEENWTGLFTPGERVKVRVINAAAGTFFDVRIPGVPLTIVEADGQPVEPVETDEFRISPAETYDFVVTLPEDRAYALYAEAMDRSGFASGTFAPRAGMVGALPRRRRRPRLTMQDMGMDHGAMDHAAMGHGAPAAAAAADPDDEHAGHDMSGMGGDGLRAPGTLPEEVAHGPALHGIGNAMVPDRVGPRLHEPGSGLGEDGWRVFTYADLRARAPYPGFTAPTREVEIHLTGNMERFTWAIDGVPFHEAEPIRFTFGERIRFTMVNDTMMAHPMHLHGMWMELENGAGERIARKHTINVKPAEKVSLLVHADAPGRWAFHCHLLYHMEVGMFRVVEVSEDPHAGHHEHGD